MTGEEKLIAFTKENYPRTVTRVGDRVLHFLGFAHSNASAIIGDTSVILIDALDSPGYALDMKKAIGEVTDKPIRTIIFTHGHPDHRGGAGAFRDTVTEVISFTPVTEVMQGYDRINDVLMKRGRFQHGYGLTDEEAVSQGVGIREGKETGRGAYDFLRPTTIYGPNTDIVTRTIDGVSLILKRAPGETDDQIFIAMPDEGILFTGDNYYGCFPNLYALRGTPYRDIGQWVRTLDDILALEPEALLPGHTKPLLGHDLIQKQVGAFRDAIRFVLDETLSCMNRGLTIEETVEAVKLPAHLRDLPFLGEYYGTMEWSVRSVYQGYVGWFDGDPVHLLPSPEKKRRAELVSLIGKDKLMERVRELIGAEDFQMAMELLALSDEKDETWKDLMHTCLLGRSVQVTSANARHYYIQSAKELKGDADAKRP